MFTVEGALQWLETNQDRPLDELKEEFEAEKAGVEAKATDGVAASIVCEDCQKKFRDEAGAQYHATKSGHTNFAQSTEGIAPLTEEQKAEKIQELRAKAAVKKAAQSEQDKADQKRNEVSSSLKPRCI